jgi:hypothetical protein
MSERAQIILVVNVIAVIALAATWLSGQLSWPVGAQIFSLWLLCPFGIVWSWPEGKPLSIWRTVVSLVAIGAASEIVGLLF